MGTSDDEMLYEYLERRPVAKFFFVLIMTIICLVGFTGNFFIAYQKLRRRSQFDLLIANVAVGMIILTLRLSIFLIEEATHNILTAHFCYLLVFSIDLGLPLIIFPLIAMVLLIKLQPNISRLWELLVVIFSWIFAVLSMIPSYRMTVVEINSFKIPHKMCSFVVESNSDPLIWKIRYFVVQTLETDGPFLFLIIFFIALATKKSVNVTKLKNVWVYSIIMTFIFLQLMLAIQANTLAAVYLNRHLFTKKLIYGIIYSLWTIVAINPIVYFTSTKIFSSDSAKCVKYRRDSEADAILIEGEEISESDIE